MGGLTVGGLTVGGLTVGGQTVATMRVACSHNKHIMWDGLEGKRKLYEYSTYHEYYAKNTHFVIMCGTILRRADCVSTALQ